MMNPGWCLFINTNLKDFCFKAKKPGHRPGFYPINTNPDEKTIV